MKHILLLILLGFSGLLSAQTEMVRTDTLEDSLIIRMVSKKGTFEYDVKDKEIAKVFLLGVEDPIKGTLEIHNKDTLKIDDQLLPIAKIEKIKLQSSGKTVGGVILASIGAVGGSFSGWLLFEGGGSNSAFVQIASVLVGLGGLAVGATFTLLGTGIALSSLKRFKAEKYYYVVLDSGEK